MTHFYKCLQCGRKKAQRWRNIYINYYDFKCKACGYVWHEVAPPISARKGQGRAAPVSKKRSTARRNKNR